MPLYEYYCEKDDRVFESLRLDRQVRRAGEVPEVRPRGGPHHADDVRLAVLRQGAEERVPFHHHPSATSAEKRTIAPVKPQREAGDSAAKRKARKAKK